MHTHKYCCCDLYLDQRLDQFHDVVEDVQKKSLHKYINLYLNTKPSLVNFITQRKSQLISEKPIPHLLLRIPTRGI